MRSIAGHGYVDDRSINKLETAVEALRLAAAGVGMNLRADLQLTEPDPVVEEPIPPPPPEGEVLAAKAAKAPARPAAGGGAA